MQLEEISEPFSMWTCGYKADNDSSSYLCVYNKVRQVTSQAEGRTNRGKRAEVKTKKREK